MSIFSQISLYPAEKNYKTEGGIEATRTLESIDLVGATDDILKNIDNRKGVLFSSSYEYPGRYSRWDIGFVNPCLELQAFDKDFFVTALNERGKVLMNLLYAKIQSISSISRMKVSETLISGTIQESGAFFTEDNRTKQPTIFTVIKGIKELFASEDDSFLGLYGAFGYDLVFQFEPMELKHPRNYDRPDLVLYIPDDITIVDHRISCAYRIKYEFSTPQGSTAGLPRDGVFLERKSSGKILPEHCQGEYAKTVTKAIEAFKKGDLFEAVPSHSLFTECPDLPSQVFKRLKLINPSPYGFIINLGSEFLVGSSPEMYVRVEGDRIETCPISGTIKRGKDAIEDAQQIRSLLNSYKDEAELTMCTDVDRNDKSRVCIPGTVKVIGRRQLEFYSNLIHTVDHVEGRLSPLYDSIDAFITHMWAVTVTGAPKRAAIRWIEAHEDSARGWYGGAVGYFAFNGDLNTGLTLRTIRIQDDYAEIRVGATLLYDSVPENEETETYTKAAALMQAVGGTKGKGPQAAKQEAGQKGKGKRILFVDHEDSFVHTLSSYFKQTGAEVLTLRAPLAREMLKKGEAFELVVLSPGPGRPEEFKLKETIELCVNKNIPVFGVCLGLQGLVEYFGGSLGQLDYPMHGKTSLIKVSQPGSIFTGLPTEFSVGRYHSLFVLNIPDSLQVTALSDDGVVMAIEHKELPVAAVQFHPESILTSREQNGFKLIDNVIANLGEK